MLCGGRSDGGCSIIFFYGKDTHVITINAINFTGHLRRDGAQRALAWRAGVGRREGEEEKRRGEEQDGPGSRRTQNSARGGGDGDTLSLALTLNYEPAPTHTHTNTYIHIV